MNHALSNHAYTTYTASLRADADHEKACAAMVRACNGKRTEELIAACAMIVVCDMPQTTYRITCTNGQFNARFEVGKGNTRDETATSRFRAKFGKHLPKIKAASHANAVDPVTSMARRIKSSGVTKAQAYAAVELAFAKKA